MANSQTAPPRKSRRWWFLGFGVVAAVGLAFAAVVTAPKWAGSFVEEQIKERAQARLGTEIELGSLEFDFEHLELRGVNLEIAEGSALTFDEVTVYLVEGSVWNGEVVVDRVETRGGQITGNLSDYRDFVDRLQKERSGSAKQGQGRVRVRPSVVEIEAMAMDLRWPARKLSAVGTLSARVDLEKGRLSLELDRGDLRRGQRKLELRRLRTEIERSAEGGPVFPITLEIEGGATPLTPEISVADLHGEVSLTDNEITELQIDLAGSFSDRESAKGEGDAIESGDLWSIAGKVRRDLSAGEIKLDMAAFELAKVPQVLERLPLVDSEDATVGGEIGLHFAEGKADVRGELVIEGLNVKHAMLASEVVRDVGFSLEIEASIDPGQSELVLREAKFERGGVILEVDGLVRHPEEIESRRYEINLSIPPVPCKQLLRAIPVELVPSLQGFVLAGDFEMSAAAKIDFADLESVSLTGKVGIDKCKVKSAPPRVAASRLMHPFTHRAVMRDGRAVVVELHPGSGDYTPLDEISEYMVAAVQTTEDGSFWRHHGFLTSQFEVALR
ncbi:MAG TPA: hypothetical protein ENJ18_17160, partial [Nannocystis exedens]|nr:hypothetical protein [Nannocystis exedens]